ncbi:hypothetical protein PC123_g5484 [Phytophthora cactorum]|nr:hypothetical protein PC123_g5484 [Phytophthora cactorum]
MREVSKGELSVAKHKAELQLSVSVRTSQRTLARVDWLVFTKMVNTLPLKPEDMLARQAWARACRDSMSSGYTKRRQAGGGSAMVRPSARAASPR